MITPREAVCGRPLFIRSLRRTQAPGYPSTLDGIDNSDHVMIEDLPIPAVVPPSADVKHALAVHERAQLIAGRHPGGDRRAGPENFPGVSNHPGRQNRSPESVGAYL